MAPRWKESALLSVKEMRCEAKHSRALIYPVFCYKIQCTVFQADTSQIAWLHTLKKVVYYAMPKWPALNLVFSANSLFIVKYYSNHKNLNGIENG